MFVHHSIPYPVFYTSFTLSADNSYTVEYYPVSVKEKPWVQYNTNKEPQMTAAKFVTLRGDQVVIDCFVLLTRAIKDVEWEAG